LFCFLAFVLATLWFTERPGLGRGAAAGLALGLSILTRPNTVFMLPLLCIWAFWQFRENWRHLSRAAVIPALAVGILSPWTARNYAVFHEFIPLATSGGSGLLQGNNDVVVSDPKYFGYSIWDSKIPEYREALQSAGNEFERDRRAKVFAVQWLKNHPDQWWFLVRQKLWRSRTPILQAHSPWYFRAGMIIAWGPVLVLWLLGFFPTLNQFLRARHPGWLIHLGIVHYLLTSVIFYALVRYRMAVEPLCIILAVQTVVLFARRLKQSKEMTGGTSQAAETVAAHSV